MKCVFLVSNKIFFLNAKCVHSLLSFHCPPPRKRSQQNCFLYVLLLSPNHFSDSFADELVPVWQCFSCNRKSKTGHSTPDAISQYPAERNSIFWPAVHMLPNAMRYIVGFPCHGVTLLAYVLLLAHQDSQVIASWQCQDCTGAWDYSIPSTKLCKFCRTSEDLAAKILWLAVRILLKWK